MPRVLPALAVVCAAIALACSGGGGDDSDASVTPVQPSATPTATAVTEATSTPQTSAITPAPPERLALLPYTGTEPVTTEKPRIYDVSVGALVPEDSTTFQDAWLDVNPLPWGVGDGHSLALFDRTSGTWRVPGLAGQLNLIASQDGKHAAVTVSGRLFLFDLVSNTRQQIGDGLLPVAFSPNGSLLLLQELITAASPPGSMSSYWILPVAGASQAFELPPGTLPGSTGQYWPHWLDDHRVLVFDSAPGAIQVQIFDVSTSPPSALTEAPVSSSLAAISRDGSMLAVESGDEQKSPSVEVYRIDPFEPVTTIDGASLGLSADVPGGVWSSDDSALLVTYDVCGENERLVSYELATGTGKELARGGIMRWVFSPDDDWVAYTAWPDAAYVVPADGSSDPTFVSADTQGTLAPRWTGDSRYAVFTRTVGGYDRCGP